MEDFFIHLEGNFQKNPYLCRVKSIFCEEELLYYPN